jgi:hypothetical protein
MRPLQTSSNCVSVLSWNSLGRRSVSRRVGGELPTLDIHGRQLHAVVEDDALEPGERIGSVARAADRHGERLGLLERDQEERYANTTETNLCLDRHKPIYVGALLETLIPERPRILATPAGLRAACNRLLSIGLSVGGPCW